jgi:hypothetical protein
MARLRLIRRLLVRLGEVGPGRRALVAEAVLCLLAARLALIVVPFPKLARRLGRFVPPEEARRVVMAPIAPHARSAAEIGWAVTRAARYVPFKAVCLPQAMAARVMLKRRGVASTMRFGAAKGDMEPLDTHAWLDAGGVRVTGYPVSDRFVEVACFV